MMKTYDFSYIGVDICFTIVYIYGGIDENSY